METRLTSRISVLFITFVVLGVYYPALFAPLNSVDDPGMYHYLLNADDLSLRNIFFPGGSGSYYRPLLAASFLVDKYVWGLEESFMHLGNIVFHLLNTLLVFAIARKTSQLLSIVSGMPALLAALLFALHPINTEAVIWISGRTDLLAGFFILLTTYILLNGTTTILFSAMAAITLLMACLAKETAIFFLPAACLVPFYIPGKESEHISLRKEIVTHLPHLLVILVAGSAYFTFRIVAFSQGDNGIARVVSHVAGADNSGVLATLRVVLKAAGFYAKKLFLPFPLNFGITQVSDLYSIVGLMVFCLVGYLLIRRNIISFYYIAAISVGASALMIPLLKMTWTPLAERYMYITSSLCAIGLAFTVHSMSQRYRVKSIVLCAVTCIMIVYLNGTASRAILWQDNMALFRDTINKSPDFLPAQNEYANALYRDGREQEAFSLLKSLTVPENLVNFQYGLVSKAAALIHERNFDGARTILNKVLVNPGKHEVMITRRLLSLNEYEVKVGAASKGKYYPENVRLLTRLNALTGDPFYLYRLGQVHLFHNESKLAREAFARVVAQASPRVYYREAAEKLVMKLSTQ